MKIILNGEGVNIHGSQVSYSDVVAWAGGRTGAIYSITYRRASSGKEGILSPGQSVEAAEAAVFNAHVTGNA